MVMIYNCDRLEQGSVWGRGLRGTRSALSLISTKFQCCLLCHFDQCDLFTRVITYSSVVHAFQVNLLNTTSALSLINASSLPMSLNNFKSHIKKKHLSIHHYCPLCDMMRLECFDHIFYDYQNKIDHFTKKYKWMQDRVKILWVVKSFFSEFQNLYALNPWYFEFFLLKAL